MAEVLDIITRLQYQANTGALDESFEAIEKNIKSIDRNAASIVRLEAIREKTDKANINRINQINVAIENRRKKIDDETRAITKEIQANDKLKVSLLNAFGTYTNLTNKVDKFTQRQGAASQVVLDFSRIIQDAPYGIQGYANNIDQVVGSLGRFLSGTGSAKTALKELGASLIGGAGIGLAISIVTSLLITFGDELFATSRAAEAANAAYKDFLKTLASDSNNALRAINEQTNRAQLLYRVIQKGGKAGAEALRQLKDEFPGITKGLTDNEIQAGKGLGTLQKQIKAREIGNLASKTQVLLQEQLAKAEGEVSAARSKSEIAQSRLNSAQKAFDNARGDSQERQLGILSRAQKEAKAAADALQSAERNVTNFRNAVTSAGDQAVAGFTSSSDLQSGKDPAPEKVKERARLRLGIPTDPEIESFAQDVNELRILQKLLEDIYNDSSLSANNLIGGGEETPASRRLRAQLEIQQDISKKEVQSEKDATERKQKNLELIKTSYLEFRDSILGIIQSIYDRQIALLDQEVNIRRDRVSQAVLIAERGNSEILKQEQERLDEAQAKREEIARKQLQINSLLQASSAAIAATQAIQTVTNAGATGDPYSTAARIAAAIAALAAGFAFVTNLTNAFKVDSFKDGVVDYQGRGTGTSDSNTVKISHGESVITAKATRQYKPILEMMNKGIPVPITMPYPTSTRDNYKSLEKRLDALISLQEGNGINVRTNVTNGQIATIVESQRSFERRRRS